MTSGAQPEAGPSARAGRQAAAELLERDSELAAIEDLLAAAQAGQGRSLVVEGPAGIGKTRLFLAAVDRARESQMTVLATRGGELELDVPLGIVQKLLAEALSRAIADERTQLLSGSAGFASWRFGLIKTFHARCPPKFTVAR